MNVMKALKKKEKAKLYRQLDEQHAVDYDALILYTLMIGCGYRKKRLRKFWELFRNVHEELMAHYEMQSYEDNVWLAHKKLKEIGVDVKKWYEEEANAKQSITHA